MFKATVEARPVEIFRGIVRRTLSMTDRALMAELTINKGSGADSHTHDSDELCYIISGRIRARIGGETRELGPGESYSLPAGEDHAIEALEDSVCVIAFSPPRRDYID